MIFIGALTYALTGAGNACRRVPAVVIALVAAVLSGALPG